MNTDTAQSIYETDIAFDSQYPIYIRELSELHWTPLAVIAVAARYLGRSEADRILDIGSGAGKFCIAGTHFAPGHFTGIEQRKNFVNAGNKLIRTLGCTHATMLHGNFMDMNLKEYTGIYFFNSFHENIVLSDALDEKIELSADLYELYTAHLLAQLRAMPAGTRLATYWLSITEIPGAYRLEEQHFDGLLKLWIKEK